MANFGKFDGRQLVDPGREILPRRGLKQESEVGQFQQSDDLRKYNGMESHKANSEERELDEEVKTLCTKLVVIQFLQVRLK